MWNEFIAGEQKQEYYQQLESFIARDSQDFNIFPAKENWFRAFELSPFEQVKVVIIGQDPYHGLGQAHGLSFSVPKGVKIPPSLRNIYKELSTDIGMEPPTHGNLESWADQGVLLLNSVLTVREASAASHQKKGWEIFTDHVIEKLNSQRDNLVFILWGSPAQKKGKNIDRAKHLVLEAVHPSPLSAYRGFFGCKHFSQANEYLAKNSIEPINWDSLN